MSASEDVYFVLYKCTFRPITFITSSHHVFVVASLPSSQELRYTLLFSVLSLQIILSLIVETFSQPS